MVYYPKRLTSTHLQSCGGYCGWGWGRGSDLSDIDENRARDYDVEGFGCVALS